MKSRHLLLVGGLVLCAQPAQAHYHLDQPASENNQAVNGDPQKPANNTDMCPAGTATGMVTQVRAGGQLRVRITETIIHPGHYRVSFAAAKASFSLPVTTVSAGNNCNATTIQGTPVLPVLADGLWVHTAANFCNGTNTCETDLTIPANTAPGTYYLQVMEWMLNHAAGGTGMGTATAAYGCYYIHCATIQVVAPDAGVSDSGVVVVDSGGGGTDSGGGGTTDSGGGGGDGGGTGGGDGGGTGTGGGNFRNPTPPNTSDGCSVTSGAEASLVVPGIAAIAGLSMLRRRRKRS
jgi:MYXO-CTERM domain-containing protein